MSQLALTISFALLASLAVSLFLNPMLISLEKSPNLDCRQAASGLGAGAAVAENPDGWLLFPGISQRLSITLAWFSWVLFSVLALGAMVFFTLERELLPTLDQREFLLRVNTPAELFL